MSLKICTFPGVSMYESYFNLRQKPFELVPDPHFIYLSKSHKKALTYLDYGIRERAGFILLTGEVGSGKTTLIRDLLNKHYEHAVLSKIFNTRVTSEQLLAMINDDYGLATQGKDKVTLIRDLNMFLVEQYALGKQPILIIDEAQNLSAELLEEVRMLSNLESSDSKLLQIILVGQPELRTILSTPELRQLRQRININCHLQALNRSEVEQYISRRLEVAGNVSAVRFSQESLDAIFRASQGIPRLINIICDFSMLSAFADQTASLSIEMVQDVISDLDFDNHYWSNTHVESDDKVASTVTPSLPTDCQEPLQKLFSMISDISHRIESVETMVEPLKISLQDQSDRLVSFQSAVTAHVTKTTIHIQELNKRLDGIMTSHGEPEQAAPILEPKVGFMRRMFGVAVFSRQNK